MNASQDEAVMFQLARVEDHSGVSGTGLVAVGMKAPEPNGHVVLFWLTEQNSVAVYESIEEMMAIHGHGGATQIVPVHQYDVHPGPS